MINLLKKFIYLTRKKQGLTLIEILVFIAIFSVISIAFVSILLTVLQVQNRESSRAEVNRQSQFLLNVIQRFVEESSLIETENEVTDVGGRLVAVPTSTLTFRVTSSTDYIAGPPEQFLPVAKNYIYLDQGKAYLKEGENGIPQALTSDRVVIDRLEFVKRIYPDALDSVDVTIGIHYNATNIQKRFSQLIQTGVARINAATFDSDIVPSSTANPSALQLGVPGRKWGSVNGVIYFGNSNVGIGAAPDSSYGFDVLSAPSRLTSPVYVVAGGGGLVRLGIGTTTATSTDQELTIVGGMRLIPAGGFAKDTCDDSTRGSIWFEKSGGDDLFQICVKVGGIFTWYNLMATTSAPY